MRAATAPEVGARGIKPPDPVDRHEVLESLRAEIGCIERRSPASTPAIGTAAPAHSGWTFGEARLDALVGEAGLEIGAVHEVKPSASCLGVNTAAGWAALCASGRRFSLALAARRLATVQGARRYAPVLVCSAASQTAELGLPYGPGLAALGVDPGRLVLAEPAKAADVLWAIEQGLASQGLAMVIGEVGDVGLTAARRLALAAARSCTPCVLVTNPRAAAAAATSTRWAIAPAPGARNALDPHAPGAARLSVALERCRTAPGRTTSFAPLLLEWCDAAYRFRVASGVADRSSRKGLASGREGPAVAAGGRA